MGAITDDNVLELSFDLCMDLYKFFTSNKYKFNGSSSIAGLSYYLSARANTNLSFNYVEFLLKKVLDKNIIRLHPASYRYIDKTDDVVQILETDPNILENKIKRSLLNKRTFPTDLTNSYHYNQNNVLNAVYTTIIKYVNSIPANNIVRLFENYDIINEDSIFKLYKFFDENFGSDFSKDVKSKYEKSLGLKLSIDDIKKLVLADNKPRNLKETIKITIELLNMLRLSPSLGGEDCFNILSYHLSSMCNGYIRESFIYYVIQKLEGMGLLHLERINNFGERHYTICDSMYYGINKDQREKRMVYIINNIDQITEEVSLNCPSPFKEKIPNPLIFDVIKTTLYMDNYSKERNLTPMEFNELTSKLLEINSLSGEDTFKSIMYDFYKNSILVEELWSFFKERHEKYYPFKIHCIQEVTDQIKIRNNLYQKFKTSKDENILDRIIDLDKKYMSYYSDILEEELKELKELNVFIFFNITEDVVDFFNEETHCLKFFADIVPGRNSEENYNKAHNFFINKGFEYDGKRNYEYVTFQDLVVVFNVFFDRADYYLIKTHLEDLGINVFYSNMKDRYFSCSLEKKEYDSISKLQEWKKDDFGHIHISLN